MDQKELKEIRDRSKAEKKGFETSMMVLEGEIHNVEDYINESKRLLEGKKAVSGYDMEEIEEDEMLLNKAQGQVDILWKVYSNMLDAKNRLYF